MWDFTQALENHALRAKLQLSKTLTGVLVCEPAHPGPEHPLRKGDIITRIGPHDIDNWGMVRIRDDLRLSGNYLIHGLAKEGTVGLTVVRDGKARSVDLPVATEVGNRVIRNLWCDYPSYFVWGPLAFSPATTELVNVLSPYLSDQWSAQGSPLLLRQNDVTGFEGEQLVVVTWMFPHGTSKGYDSPIGRVVTTVNGSPIRNLRHLVETLRDATDQYVEFEFAGKYAHTLVFDRQEVGESMEEILSDNGIRRQCSKDLRGVWRRDRP
jgi:S1-C subfamily serine protease